MTVALAMKAAIGDVTRFDEPQKLVSYLGLNPSVRQSGPGLAYHGRITKQGRGHARGMLVEAAWAAARAPGARHCNAPGLTLGFSRWVERRLTSRRENSTSLSSENPCAAIARGWI
jgi:hypothetical protein